MTSAPGDIGRAAVMAAIGPPDDARQAWCHITDSIDLANCWDADLLDLLPAIWSNAALPHDDVPQRSRLRGVHHHRWCASNLAAHQVTDAVGLLDSAGIESRLAGGLHVATRAYPDLGSRAVDDTTLVIAPVDLPRTGELLAAHGFVVTAGNRAQLRCSRGTSGAFTVATRTSPWFTDDPMSGDTVDVTGHRLSTVTVEDELLSVLCGGPMTVAPRGVRWVVDVARLLALPSLDVARLLTVVEQQSLAAPVRTGLDRARDFGITADAELLAGLTSIPVSRKDQRLAERAAAPITGTRVVSRLRRAVLRGQIMSRREPLHRAALATVGSPR